MIVDIIIAGQALLRGSPPAARRPPRPPTPPRPLLSGTREWWFMKWRFSNGFKMPTSIHVCESLAQTWLGLMCNQCVWWHTVASRTATSLTP